MKLICSFCLMIMLTGLRAQQLPHYSQYMLNQYIINPALTGIENYIDVKASHRHQWVGIDGAPVTTYLSAHAPIGKKDFRTSATGVRIPGENPRGKQWWEDYTASEPHHGIGIQLINDKTGPLNRFSGYLTYAYHVGISGKTSLAAGFGAGLTNLRLNTDKLNFGVITPVDPAVYENRSLNYIRPDFTAGLYLYSASYFLGLSAQQIIPQKIKFSDNAVSPADGKQVPHVFATAGYRFLLTEDFNCMPSVMVKYIKPLPVQADLNVKLQYHDLAWIGASYRTGEGFAAMLGMNISSSLNIGYAYDYTTTRLNTVSKGTHEILIGFMIGNKYGSWCPKNVW
ncbi:type IX secretion system membrane protein PorP/SprF [Pseudoflavitalea sp. G-6-1-2]|uniref:PorP/SprF family type IX secretion system membrane protein n=1 Tax=Pseudoflavitalea sp. G-6-1-2 TaxID=2728841 RepID=UPI001469B21D|nr:type IX secretion system membrane protein PorP/SprF [Pseudoflavitalea sp. G-6-1-2]NML23630.1 type IX secretion system membrane protein PorP/SprF [Pseudoflavitalea sp. G-6-1-2]